MSGPELVSMSRLDMCKNIKQLYPHMDHCMIEACVDAYLANPECDDPDKLIEGVPTDPDDPNFPVHYNHDDPPSDYFQTQSVEGAVNRIEEEDDSDVRQLPAVDDPYLDDVEDELVDEEEDEEAAYDSYGSDSESSDGPEGEGSYDSLEPQSSASG